MLAVVACWGRVVPGTRGLRAQHARIEAIWLSARVPPHLAKRLRQRYPSATFYRSRRLMLRRHQPTWLNSYGPVRTPQHERQRAFQLRQDRQRAFVHHPAVRPFVLLLWAYGLLSCACLLAAGLALAVHALL